MSHAGDSVHMCEIGARSHSSGGITLNRTVFCNSGIRVGGIESGLPGRTPVNVVFNLGVGMLGN